MLSARKQGFIIRKTRRFDESRLNDERRHMSQTQFYPKSSPLTLRSPGHILHVHQKQDHQLSYSNYIKDKNADQNFQSNPQNQGVQTKFNFEQTNNDLMQKGQSAQKNLNDNSFQEIQVPGGFQTKVNLKIQENVKLAKILQKLYYQLQHRSHSKQVLQCVKTYIQHTEKNQLTSVNNLPISMIRKKIIKDSMVSQRFSVLLTGLIQVLGEFEVVKSFLMNLIGYSLENLLLRLAILTEGKEKSVVQLLKEQKKQKLLNKGYDSIKNNNQILSESIKKVSNVDKGFCDVFKKLIKQNKILDAKNQFLAARQFIAYFLCESGRYEIAPFLAISPAPYLPTQQFQKYTLVIDIFECMLTKNKKSVQTFRPFAQYFLDQLSQYYQIVSFSDLMPTEANKIINLLDRKKLIKYRLYKHHFNKMRSTHGKDLTRLGRDMDKVILIDTLKQPDSQNTIVVSPWKGKKNDAELAELCPILAMIVLKKLSAPKAIKKLQQKNEQNMKIGLKHLNCGVNLQ